MRIAFGVVDDDDVLDADTAIKGTFWPPRKYPVGYQ